MKTSDATCIARVGSQLRVEDSYLQGAHTGYQDYRFQTFRRVDETYRHMPNLGGGGVRGRGRKDLKSPAKFFFLTQNTFLGLLS